MFGRTILRRMQKSLAPSSRAASIISSGRSSMNCLTRYNPTGMESMGTMCAQMLSTNPSLLMMI